MQWIVRVALERPYSFVVLAILIVLLGPLETARTPTDIFPDPRPGDRRGLDLHGPFP
jgi:multidrug efflux pump subunit AcrB